MHPFVRYRLKELSSSRNKVFVRLERNRPLGKDYEDVGLAGEWAFAEFSGIMVKVKPGGDGGVDFELPVVFTVDVKTSRKGDALLVESGKVKADIYVLAHYVEEVAEGGEGEAFGRASLVGWTSAYFVKSVEPVDTGRGVVNHRISASELRPMSELRKMMGKVRRE